ARLLDQLELPEPADVALAAVEAGVDERAHELGGDGGADDLRAEAQHVHVVVLDALVRAVALVADGGAGGAGPRGRGPGPRGGGGGAGGARARGRGCCGGGGAGGRGGGGAGGGARGPEPLELADHRVAQDDPAVVEGHGDDHRHAAVFSWWPPNCFRIAERRR